MTLQLQARAGTPGPDTWIRHQRIQFSSKGIEGIGALYEGATLVSGTPYAGLVTCAGASRGRVRFKANVGGELKLEFVRPFNGRNYEVDVYASGNPDPVTVVADTETLLTTSDIAGEASCLVTFTPSDDGAVTLFDWMAL